MSQTRLTRPQLEEIRTTHRFKTAEELQSEYGREWRMQTPGFHQNFDGYLGKTIGKVNIKETPEGAKLQVKLGNNVTIELLTPIKKVSSTNAETVDVKKAPLPKKETKKVVEEKEPDAPVKPEISEDKIYDVGYENQMRKYIKDYLVYKKKATDVQDITLNINDGGLRVYITGGGINAGYTLGSSRGTATCCGLFELGTFGYTNSSTTDKDVIYALSLLVELGLRQYVRTTYNGGYGEKRRQYRCFFASLLTRDSYKPIRMAFENVDFMSHATSFVNSNSGNDVELWCFSYGDLFSK